MTSKYYSLVTVTVALVIAVVIYSPMYNAMYLRHLPDPTSDLLLQIVELLEILLLRLEMFWTVSNPALVLYQTRIAMV